MCARLARELIVANTWAWDPRAGNVSKVILKAKK